MRQFLTDVRYGIRVLCKSPGFTAIAILVLAIGIGANTAVFSVVYNVLLKPLNYRQPERLVTVLTQSGGPVSPAEYLDYREQSDAFEALEAAEAWAGAIETRDRAEVTPGLKVSAGMMKMLGVLPERGRLFRPGEDQPGAEPVILISHNTWQRRLGGDPNIIGRTITIDAKPFTVIGVMPPDFQFAPFWQTQAEMWIPFDLSKRVQDRTGRSVRLFGRLKQGVTLEQAREQMMTIARRLENRYPASNTGVSVSVLTLQEKVVGSVRPTLIVLLATVAFVLLIACANIANLLLTRAVAKRREIAVRLAMGAKRWQLVRQLGTESLLVSTAGGLTGTLLAHYSLALLPRVLPVGSLPRQGEIAIETWVLTFALGISVLAGVLAGLLPAVDSSNVDVSANLKEGSRGSTGGTQRRTRGLLVATEVSLALILLVCAGLMIRTLAHLNAVDPGFNASNLVTMQIYAPASYDTAEKRLSLFQRVHDALATVPGIERVSAINHLPISGDVWTIGYKVPGRPDPVPGHEPGGVYRVIRPGYFTAMQIPLADGREFSARDNAGAAPVIMVNEALARRQWPGESAVGKSLEVQTASGPTALTIIGVAKNSRQSDWTSAAADEFYLPYLQHANARGLTNLAFVARTRAEAVTVLSLAEQRVRAIDQRIAISKPMAMEQVIADKLWRSRLTALLLGAFAAIALVLAGIGIYGVISYSVRLRTREIGIRVALGATRTDVMRLVLREGLTPVCAGILTGLTAALAAGQWLASLLYGVRATDPLTLATVVLGLLFIACIATSIPALRTLRGNVLSTLRHE